MICLRRAAALAGPSLGMPAYRGERSPIEGVTVDVERAADPRAVVVGPEVLEECQPMGCQPAFQLARIDGERPGLASRGDSSQDPPGTRERRGILEYTSMHIGKCKQAARREGTHPCQDGFH